MKFWLLIILQILFVLANFGQKPEVVVQTGHDTNVVKIAFSHDGKLLASGDFNGVVKIWDLLTNKELRTLITTSRIDELTFSTDDKLLFVSTKDTKVHSFEVISGVENSIIENNENKGKFAKSVISSAQSLIAQIIDFNIVRVSNLNDGKEIYRYSLPDSEKDKIKLPPGDDGKEQFTYFGGEFGNLAISPNGNYLAASTFEGKIALVEAKTGQTLRIIKTTRPSFLSFSLDEKLLAVVEKIGQSEKSILNLYSLSDGQIYKTIDIPQGEVEAVAFSPNNKVLGGVIKIGNKDKTSFGYTLNLWNIESGLVTIQSPLETDFSSDFPAEIKFNPTGKTLAITSIDTVLGRIFLFDIERGIEISRLQSEKSIVFSLRFLKDDLLSANQKIWNLNTGRILGQRHRATSIFSSDGKREVFDDSGTLTVNDLESGKTLINLVSKPFEYSNGSLIFSPNNRFILAYSSPQVWDNSKFKVSLFDINTGNIAFQFPDKSGLAVFSSNGKFLAYATAVDVKNSKYAVKVWDLEMKKQICQISLNQVVNAISFTPKNDFLAVAGDGSRGRKDDRFLSIFETPTGKIHQQFGNQGRITEMTFSPDGTLLATNSEYKIRLLNIENATETIVLKGYDSLIYKLAFSPNGKYLLSGGSDGQIIFWNFKSGEIISRLILVGDNDYVFLTPENYYLASRKGAASAVAFRQGTSAVPFEQYDIRNNRPDLVIKALGIASPEQIELYHQSFKKRLRQNGLTETDLSEDLKLPKISIETEQIPILTKEKILRFKVFASDNDYSLSKLNVQVNDVSIYGKKGFIFSEKNTKTILKEVELQLTEGNNRIQVSVFNEKGIESIRRTFNIKYSGDAPKPELYVVAVGVSNYKDEKYNLKYPAIDVANIIKLFENRTAEKETAFVISPNPGDKTGLVEQTKSFYQFHKLELTNENAILEKINGIRGFLKNAKPEDEVVVFFSGHGLLDIQKNYYFATHDIDFKNPEKRGLSFEVLEDLLNETAARRKILLLDTCHAGEVDKSEIENLKISTPKSNGVVKGIEIAARSDVVNLDNNSLEKVDEITNELFADLRLGSGAIVVSASGGLEYAYESPKWSGGVFTYTLRLGLEEMKADANRDGKITIAELREFVGKNVFELTEGRQKPNIRGESVEFDFRVY